MNANLKKYLDFEEDYRNKHNNVPKFFAFDEKDFDKNYKKFKEKYNEVKDEKLVYIGYGCYTTQKHLDELVKLNQEGKQEKKEMFKNDDVLKQALIHEMWNIEYGFNEDDDRLTEELLDKKFDDLSPRELDIFRQARRDYYNNFEG